MQEHIHGYEVVFESYTHVPAYETWGAYVPALLGCVAVATTRESVRARITVAISEHVRGLQADALADHAHAGPDVPVTDT